MAPRTRFQALVEDDTAEVIKKLATRKGLSESAMCRLLIKEALELPHNKRLTADEELQSAEEATREKIALILEVAKAKGLL